MEDSFLTLAAPGEAETRVRGSVFLALAAPAAGEDAARTIVQERERAMWDASHHCYAWRLRGGLWCGADAGEPSGSAGAPILAAIAGAGLLDCVVVVTRYFGGIKLGVGGLVRAYGEAAALALDAAPRRRAIPALRLRIRYPYEHTSAVMRSLERAEAEEVEHGYAAGGREGEIELTAPRVRESLLRDLLRDATAGALTAELLEERTLYRPDRGYKSPV